MIAGVEALVIPDLIRSLALIDASEEFGAAATIDWAGTTGAISAWLFTVSWQLLPLTAVVIVLDFALRRAGPVVRSALWWMVLAKLIVPPGIASPLSVGQLWPSWPLDDSTRAALSATVAHSGAAADAGSAVGTSSWLPLLIVSTWAFGALAAAVLACWRYRRVRTACLDGAVLLIDASPAVYDAVAIVAARQLGLSTIPPIFIGAVGAKRVRIARFPAVVGFLSPRVVLPRRLLERPRRELEHVLLHELAHVRRRDPLASLVCLVAQIVFWFHPAIWCARRRLAMLREMACDRTVARLLGDDTPAYRRTLILLARSAASSMFAAGPGALGLFQRQSELVTRLDALARPVSMRRATERAAGAATALAILVSCVPLAPSPAAPTVSIDVPPLDRLPGSLQKRYAVMRALALSEREQRTQQPSR